MPSLLSNSTAGQTDHRARPPRTFWWWLTGATVTRLASGVLSFGLSWAATGHSALLASAVLVAVVAPRVILGLLGGSVADRVGPARVMMVSDAVMTAIMVAAAITASLAGDHPWLVLGAAAAMGVADGFYQPSTGSMPKLLAPESALPRAVAANQLAAQLTGLAGPALGGIVMAAAGVPLSFAVGALGFAAMLTIMVRLRPSVPTTPQVAGGSVVGDVREGVAYLARSPQLRAIFGLSAAFAGFVIPFAPFLVPLTARAQHWTSGSAGMVGAAYAAGTAVVGLFVMWRGAHRRPGLIAALAILITGVGTTSLAVAPTVLVAVVAATVTGTGTGLFSTHIGPTFVRSAPAEMIGRLYSVMILGQNLPLLVANPLIGLLATATSASTVTAVWAAGSLAVGIWALTSRTVRSLA